MFFLKTIRLQLGTMVDEKFQLVQYALREAIADALQGDHVTLAIFSFTCVFLQHAEILEVLQGLYLPVLLKEQLFMALSKPFLKPLITSAFMSFFGREFQKSSVCCVIKYFLLYLFKPISY